MRTNVTIKSNVPQSNIEKGDKGYIDGYVQGADNRPYAVVVIPSRKIIDLVSMTMLIYEGIE